MRNWKVTLLSVMTLAYTVPALSDPARQTLIDLGQKLKGPDQSVSYVGTTSKGELCELKIEDNRWLFLQSSDRQILGDDVLNNPYYGNPQLQDHAKLQKAENNSQGVITSTVAVSSDIDKNSAELSIDSDYKGFKSGTFKIDRGSQVTCNLKLRLGHSLSATVLNPR